MRDDDYDYEYDDDDGEGRRSLNQRVAIASVGVSLLVLLLFIVIPVLTDDSGTAPSTDDDANALIVGGATEDPDATGDDDSADVTTADQSDEDQASTDAATESADDDAGDSGSQDDEADADDSAEPDVAAATDSGADDADAAAATDDSDDADDSEDASDADDSDDASDSDDATDVDDATGSDDPTGPDDPDETDDGAAEPTPSNSPSYPTLPDGSPVPVLGIYDGDTIAISGVVPSEESRQLLETLALANSKSPDATIVNFVSIDPTVPDNVGVRVLEKDSVRFPDGSADILPAHAIELDRAVSIMNALPHVSVLVIGHADQRGDEAQNYRISDNRAGAVANYLVESGISPLRVASRPVGEADLLTLNADPESLALNRRTEFVFYGLLAPPPAPADS